MTYKKIARNLVKLFLATSIVIFAMVYLLTGGKFFAKSGLSNCVVVAKLNDFDGEWLKHSRSKLYSRLKTVECIEKDKQIDSGDGPKNGKVRWAECTFGPDCDEAGLR